MANQEWREPAAAMLLVDDLAILIAERCAGVVKIEDVGDDGGGDQASALGQELEDSVFALKGDDAHRQDQRVKVFGGEGGVVAELLVV